MSFSMDPAFSHLRRIALSMGMWASIQSWLILSNEPPSSYPIQ